MIYGDIFDGKQKLELFGCMFGVNLQLEIGFTLSAKLLPLPRQQTQIFLYLRYLLSSCLSACHKRRLLWTQ